MKIYKIPADLKAFIFDIDSTLYTNQAYAFEQVDCQVRQFASNSFAFCFFSALVSGFFVSLVITNSFFALLLVG